MATGEGKTLAIGLAAAVAALAGIPVHVVTANSYLAQRDAQRLAPFYAAARHRRGGDHRHVTTTMRGARSTVMRWSTPPRRTSPSTSCATGRRARRPTRSSRSRPSLGGRAAARPAHARPVHGAARRGRQHPARRSRGAADPLAQRAAQRPARLHVAGARAGAAARVRPRFRACCRPTAAPCSRRPASSAWPNSRSHSAARGCGRATGARRCTVALAGLHAHHRNLHYVVRDDAIELLDEVTGRVAEGRVWSRGLHTVVALKEGLQAAARDRDRGADDLPALLPALLAPVRHQRHAARGTRRTARRSMRADVLPIPLHKRCRRIERAPRRFADARRACSPPPRTVPAN